MKRAAITVLMFVLAGMLLPFVGPQLGLAKFQAQAHAPGQLVRVEAGHLNVYQTGTGPDVVLVHGQPGSADMMRPLATALNEEGYRVTTYDRMGWGHSEQRDRGTPANPTAHARDLLQLIDAMGLEQPLAVGYSYGGGVVMEANRLAAEALPNIVLLSSVGDRQRRGQNPSLVGRIMSSPLVIRWMLGLDVLARAASARVFSTLEFPEQLPAAEVQALLATLALPGVPSAWARERNQRYQKFDGYQPARVAACTLVLHGSEDRVVTPEVARYVAATVPGAILEWVEQAGHALPIIRPGLMAGRITRHHRRCRSLNA